MTSSEITYKPLSTELKVLAPVIEPAMHAIPGNELELIQSPTETRGLAASANIFTISYQYNGETCRTQAMQAGTDDYAFYKVVLCSKVNSRGNLCWIQKKDGQWNVMLGDGINNELLHALALAIETR